MAHEISANPAEPVRDASPPASRRGFLSRLLGASGGLFGGGLLAGARGSSKEGQMYGPVRPAEAALQRPRAEDAAALLGPYRDGRVVERQWAVGHVARGGEGQIIIVLVDGETNGHAELELWARGPGDGQALQQTRRYALHLPGAQVAEAPPHLQTIAARVAAIVRRNEATALLQQALPGRRGVDVA